MEREAEAAAGARVALAGANVELVSVPCEGGEVELLSVPTLEDGNLTRTLIHPKELTDGYQSQPDRLKGVAKLQTQDSFVAHANTFKDDGSAVFADVAHLSFTAVLDYHRSGKNGQRHCGHRSVFTPKKSKEWMTWIDGAGLSMSQEDFAEFLEDRIQDIADPTDKKLATTMKDLFGEFASPNKLLALSRGLSVRVSQKVTNNIQLQSGERALVFEEEHKDESGSKLAIPGAFLIAIPVFELGPMYTVAARLRYRLRGGQVTWSYTLHQTAQVIDHAFSEACEKIGTETELPLFRGTPEA